MTPAPKPSVRPRRALLAWLLSPLFLGEALAHQHDAHGLGLEERLRLRRELRQAHLDRVREANSSSQASDEPVSALSHEASAPETIPVQATRPPEPGAATPARQEGLSGRERFGVHHGRMALSHEEREQLRRQLRDQRAVRRGASRASDEDSSTSPPQP